MLTPCGISYNVIKMNNFLLHKKNLKCSLLSVVITKPFIIKISRVHFYTNALTLNNLKVIYNVEISIMSSYMFVFIKYIHKKEFDSYFANVY